MADVILTKKSVYVTQGILEPTVINLVRYIKYTKVPEFKLHKNVILFVFTGERLIRDVAKRFSHIIAVC